MPMHALGVGVDAYPNADNGIGGNFLRREIQRKAHEVAIEPFRSVALPSIENNKLSHVSLEIVLRETS
jgi:hypothetical protein